MSEEQFLYMSSAVCFIMILLSFRYRKQFAIINLVLFFIYSPLLYYNLFFNSAYGASLVWWSYLLFFTLLQVLVVCIYLGIRFWQRLKQSKKSEP